MTLPFSLVWIIFKQNLTPTCELVVLGFSVSFRSQMFGERCSQRMPPRNCFDFESRVRKRAAPLLQLAYLFASYKVVQSRLCSFNSVFFCRTFRFVTAAAKPKPSRGSNRKPAEFEPPQKNNSRAASHSISPNVTLFRQSRRLRRHSLPSR